MATKAQTDKPAPIKLLKREVELLESLTERKQKINIDILEIGQQKLALDYREGKLEDNYRDVIEFEQQVVNSLTEKYGQGSIDVENSSFIPS